MRELTTGTDQLLAHVDEGVAVVTFNRPERRNALSGEIFGALAGVLAGLEDDPEVGCLVLTGAGGAFSAGGDVKDMAARAARAAAVEADGVPADGGVPARIRAQQRGQRAVTGALFGLRIPTIAAIPGPVAGAGLGLALACDLRYAVEGAVLTTAFAKVGLTGDYGVTWFLTRLLGVARARELMLLAERIPAGRAAELGLVTEVLPDEGFLDAVLDRARRLAAGPRITYRLIKDNLDSAVHLGLEEQLDAEATRLGLARTTADHREAARAFVEGRAPAFTGR